MIQPYFKPDVNPSMPAFAVFYNGYFQERSKMNMQIMNLMLQQASPQYLTSMIEKTQGNIAELQKTREKILSADQKNKSNIAIKQAEMNFSASKMNAKTLREESAFIKKLVAGESKSGSKSNFYAEKNKNEQHKEEIEIKSTKQTMQKNLLDTKQSANAAAFIQDNKLDSQNLERVALALEVIGDNQKDYINKRGTTYIGNLKLALKGLIPAGTTPDDILATEYRFARGPMQTTPTTQTTPKDRAEELGFTLPLGDAKRADQFIYKTKDGEFYIDKNYSELQNIPYFSGQSKEEIDEILNKRLKQRILQEKKGYVRAPTIPVDDRDFQSKLAYINKQLEEESKKLEGYLTRYDVGQQDVLEKMFAPFDSNYRTQNLFVRKSPEVLEQEKQIREMQYQEREDTPSGYENIKYNTEYQGLGGLNFGITKVGTEDIPYIFEGGTPYEIPQGNPSHSSILELLKEQDRKLGGK